MKQSLKFNKARMEHLDSLNLPIEGKRVLDIGCGIGHLAQYFINKNCTVTCIDSRQENINELKSRYPQSNIKTYVDDIEFPEHIFIKSKHSILSLKFDIVFAYGLLYHLENPLLALRNMYQLCETDGFLLLETLVLDSILPISILVKENLDADQAMQGLAHRPSSSYIIMVLKHIGFKHVYTTKTKPQQEEFITEWKNDLQYYRDGHNLRNIFVASINKIDNPNLKEVD